MKFRESDTVRIVDAPFNTRLIGHEGMLDSYDDTDGYWKVELFQTVAGLDYAWLREDELELVRRAPKSDAEQCCHAAPADEDTVTPFPVDEPSETVPNKDVVVFLSHYRYPPVHFTRDQVEKVTRRLNGSIEVETKDGKLYAYNRVRFDSYYVDKELLWIEARVKTVSGREWITRKKPGYRIHDSVLEIA